MKALAPDRKRHLTDFETYGFRGGINIQDSPQQLADDDLTQAINVYLSSEGDVTPRLGIKLRGPQVSANPASGMFRFYQEISNGAVSTFKQTLMQVGGTLYDADTGAQLSATNGLGGNALPWSAARVFDPAHATSPPSGLGLAFSASAGTIVAGTYGYLVTAVTGGGETLPTNEVTITTNATGEIMLSWAARAGATSYKVYGRTPGSEQLIASGIMGTTYTDTGAISPSGNPPTTTTATAAPSDILVICTGDGGPYAYDGVIVYTFPCGPTTVAGARWCELVNDVLYFSGIPSQPNLISASQVGQPESLPGYGTFTTSQAVTGLGTLGEGLQSTLVAGMNQGLALFTGVTPNSYIEQEIPSEDGVVAGRSMITVNGILYFIGNYAIYRYDGANFTEISRKVRPWILNDPLQQDFPMNGDRSKSWSMYWNNRIYFWYESGAQTSPGTALVWDLLCQGWTIYTGSLFNAATTLNAPGDASPAICVICDATKGQQYNFDVYTDSSFNISDNNLPFTCSFISKFFKIGEPGSIKHLLRSYVEIFTLTFSGSFLVITDYNQKTNASVVILQSSPGGTWDSSSWDESSWASSSLAYSNNRIDSNISGEAFAFGIQTPGPNNATKPYQIWKLMGFTGRISQYPKA